MEHLPASVTFTDDIFKMEDVQLDKVKRRCREPIQITTPDGQIRCSNELEIKLLCKDKK